jgi:hypothetical protein
MDTMAFIPVENTVQVELRFILHGQKCENTLYFHNQDGVSIAAMDQLADDINAWLVPTYMGMLPSSTSLAEVYITDLTTDTSPTVSNTDEAGALGSYTTSPALPGNATVTVSFRTNGRGRGSRGRNYIVGLGEDSVVGNTINPALKTAVENAYLALLPEISTGWQWCVVSRFLDGAPRAEGLVQMVTNVIVVDPYVDSQRRRLTGRGQ